MNAVPYHVANPAAGHAAHRFGFRNSSAYFEVYSPWIESRYSEVVWRSLDAVPLPADVVAKYDGRNMAVTGFEVNVERGEGADARDVPVYESYNHHYVSFIHGAGAALHPDDVGARNRADLRFVPTSNTAGAADVPHVQAFSEHNGNECRQTYHGLPAPYVQPIHSPRTWQIGVMQINTLSPDGPGHRGGPLPAASAAPPGARYSGILECPCTTRVVKNVSAGTINGRPFRPNCTRDAHTSDLYAKGNPTCDVSTYVGGMECCKDGDVLLDADQEVPPHVDRVRYRWRFYHEEYAPMPTDAAGRVANAGGQHVPVFHLEWAVNGCDSGGPGGNPKNCQHIEYDVQRAADGTPPAEQVHTVTSHFKVRDMMAPNCSVATDFYCADEAIAEKRGGVQLIMAGGHCHSPSCLSLELYNDDTNELLCAITPSMGTGDAPMDETDYLWLPPCQWGEEDPALRPPPKLGLDTKLRTVKRSNSSVHHYGVMGIWQMRGAYL